MKHNELKVLIVDDEIAFANTLAQRLIMRDMQVAPPVTVNRRW